MSIKRMSLRFNLDNKADHSAWEYLKNITDSKNKAVIAAINQFYEPHAEITETITGIFLSLLPAGNGRSAWIRSDTPTRCSASGFMKTAAISAFMFSATTIRRLDRKFIRC